MQEDEIESYIHHANIFHSLTAFCYGHCELTPYMMKFVDVVSKLLRNLPFKSLMRVATEGGEQTHYMHICFYYQVYFDVFICILIQLMGCLALSCSKIKCFYIANLTYSTELLIN